MTEFVAVLVLLHLLECAFLVRPGVVAFVRRGVHAASYHPSTRGWVHRFGATHLMPLLPPFGTLFFADEPEIAVGEEGLWGGGAEGAASHFVAWSSVPSVATEGTWVLLDDRRWCRCANEASARARATRWAELRDTPREERAARIRTEIHRRHDLASVRTRVDEVVERTARLRALGLAFAGMWLLLVPAALLHFGASLPALLPAVFATLLWIAAVIEMARVITPLTGLRGMDAFEVIAGLAFFPPATVHAADALTRRVDLGHDPLALALVLLPDRAAEEWARHHAAALLHPSPDPVPLDASVQLLRESYRLWRVEALDESLRARGLHPESVVRPLRRGEMEGSYCPRCHARFTKSQASCEECGGLPTVGWEVGGEEGA